MLTHPTHGYIQVAEPQTAKRNYNEELAYELALKGITQCADQGIHIEKDEFTGPFDHRLMSCKVRASVELGVTDAFKLHTWHEFKGNAPHLFPVNFHGKEIRVRPDTYPFVIEHPEEPKPVRYFILGIEVDRGTESIRSYDSARSHISTKYIHYSAFLKQRLYHELLGFPDCLILFTTTSQARMRIMQQLWLDFTEQEHRLLHKLAFKVFKDEPTGWALNEPWQFADGELLYLNQP